MRKKARPRRRILAVRGEGGAVPIEEHARRITASWRKSIEAFIQTGRLLLAAKADHSRHWCRLFSDDDDRRSLAIFNEGVVLLPSQLYPRPSADGGEEYSATPPEYDAVAHPLPFSLSTAGRLMAIAEHPVLSNSATWPNLPAGWRALSELAQIPAEKLTRLIGDECVGPETTVAEATAWRRIHTWETRLPPSTRITVPVAFARKAFALERKLERGLKTGTTGSPWRVERTVRSPIEHVEELARRTQLRRWGWQHHAQRKLDAVAARIAEMYVETMFSVPEAHWDAVRQMFHAVADATWVDLKNGASSRVGDGAADAADPDAGTHFPPQPHQ
jgi:hypothetical protein